MTHAPLPCAGHKYFELDKTTGIILVIPFAPFSVKTTSGDVLRVQIKTKENCVYTSALNKKNAEKHFKKMILQEKGYSSWPVSNQ